MKRLILTALLMVVVTAVSAQGEVSPEVQLGARGVMSFNTDIASGRTTSAVNDFSDTDVLLGFREKLYNRMRGQLVIGFQFPDADSDLGQVFYNQTFIRIDDRTNTLKIGRSRVRSTLIEFPTLRDDDALLLTYTLNPFSSGENSEEQQFGNVIELSHIFRQRYRLEFHAEHFRKEPLTPGGVETDFGVNGLGLTLAYRVPSTQRWNRPILQNLSISFNNYLTDRPGYTSEYDQALKNILLGSVINLRPDPVHFWDWRTQMIYNVGFAEVRSISDFSDMARAESFATFMSIRYLYRRFERPTVQVALSGGYKIFPKAPAATSLYQVIGNVFYRLGERFDVGMQIQYKNYSGDLRRIYGTSETRLQVSFIYSIDQSWNNQFDDRESLLNLEHGYIP